MTYAREVLAELHAAIDRITERDVTYPLRIIDARVDGPDVVVIVYEHARYPGRFGLRRNVVEGSVEDHEDARESASMVRIELDEPPPRSFQRIDSGGVAWWGDPT